MNDNCRKMTHVGTLDRGFSVKSIVQTGIINAFLLFLCLGIFTLCDLCLPAAALPQYSAHVPHCWCVASFLTCFLRMILVFLFCCLKCLGFCPYLFFVFQGTCV